MKRALILLILCFILFGASTTNAQRSHRHSERNSDKQESTDFINGNGNIDTRARYFLDKVLPSNDTNKIGEFISSGININGLGRQEPAAASILMLAIELSNRITVEYLLRKGANPNLRVRSIHTQMFNREQSYAYSGYPLETAADFNDVGKMDLLIRYGADITLCAERVKAIASTKGNTKMIDYVSKKTGYSKVHPNVLAAMTDVYADNADGLTPEIINDFVKKGADVNAYSPKGKTALINVIINEQIRNKPPLILALIKNGADLNKSDIDDPNRMGAFKFYGTRPLTAAVRAGRLDLVKILVENGADVNLDGSLKQSHNDKVTEYLILKGAR